MYRHILVPIDGSPLSASAVGKAAALAKALGARMTVMTVTEPFHVLAVDPVIVTATPAEYERLTAEHAGRYLSAAEAEVAAAGVRCATLHVKDEHTYQAIIDTAAKEGCDLIAMSSHGRHGLAALLVGSETIKVLTHSKIPVLVYR
ncbi:universal stress protein [Vineibacter terrae]|uniref:Universal stress protein n=1 Tax=Vineibacter terrae TaxID=2586908 RepID=A0A5C8PE41_9HYPH|nr:universal stress protein [Vineibacter terrae]TXL71607.1 universal stress protein [Vineibacter terrae]